MNEVPEPVAAPFRFDVLTLFPPLFEGFLRESIIGRAVREGLVQVKLWDLRHWAMNRYGQVDDRPFGGGPGMLIMAPPVVEGVRAIREDDARPGHLMMLTPSGRRFDQARARDLVSLGRLILLCGRYEGFDHRVHEILEPEAISIGDYVLSGGEVPAMVIIDAVTRLVPGALGDEMSPVDESFHDERRLVEYPQYTRPREYLGHSVPEILLSGDHAKIARWRESLRKPAEPRDTKQ